MILRLRSRVHFSELPYIYRRFVYLGAIMFLFNAVNALCKFYPTFEHSVVGMDLVVLPSCYGGKSPLRTEAIPTSPERV